MHTSPPAKPDHVLRVLVVDDEPLAREDIEQLLRERSGVAIVGTCASGSEAIDAVRRLTPDVVLLDIRMPGLDGFGVVDRFDPAHLPYVVFVTAFDEYAIEAFQVRALDYLLKPVKSARLDEALARAREQLRLRAGGRMKPTPFWHEVMVRIGLRDIVLRVDDIDWVEADTYYARLHIRGRSYLLRERMHVLESHLEPEQFARVHRSAIVNLSRVREIAHDGRGEHVIVLSTGARVKTSRQRWLAFREVMRRRAGANM
jgi:two-component system LytT family response regulator